MRLRTVIALLLAHAVVVLAGIFLMLAAFGSRIDSELDTQVERIQRDLDRDFDRVRGDVQEEIRRELRRELDARLPEAPAVPQRLHAP